MMMMKRLRVVILSLLIMLLVAGGLPLVSTLAKWSRRSAVEHGRKQGHYRKHTRAWWRRQRARQRARRARALARRQRLESLTAQTSPAAASAAALLPNAALSSPPSFEATPARAQVREAAAATAPSPRMPFEYATPQTWGVARRSAAGTVQFTLRTPAGKPAGTALLAPVNLPRDAAAGPSVSKKAVGGVSIAALRRTVIDRMVAEGGWVTNDYVREMDGRVVFVVIAQSGAPGAPTQSHTFYFTEVEGRVYSLAANAPVELAEPVAAGSEQLMSSLRPAGQNNLVRQK